MTSSLSVWHGLTHRNMFNSYATWAQFSALSFVYWKILVNDIIMYATVAISYSQAYYHIPEGKIHNWTGWHKNESNYVNGLYVLMKMSSLSS